MVSPKSRRWIPYFGTGAEFKLGSVRYNFENQPTELSLLSQDTANATEKSRHEADSTPVPLWIMTAAGAGIVYWFRGTQSTQSSSYWSIWLVKMLDAFSLFYVIILRFTRFCFNKVIKLINSVAWLHERTIPPERLPLVGEVSASFWRIEGCRIVSGADPLRP
jgi:hypothetical protein